MNLDDFSRFRQTELIIIDGKETYGRWRPLSIFIDRPSDDNIKVFEVTSALEGRPDLISHAVYGTPLLDWVLLAFNKVRDPLGWPAVGDLIEYPVESTIFPLLL
jgi:hypothetical protein